MTYLIGVDEVGRGPIAGPLVVCACAVRSDTDILHLFPKQELRDSKKLSDMARIRITEQLITFVDTKEVLFGLGEIDAERLDEIGLSRSIEEAVRDALEQVHEQGVPKDTFIVLDGSLRAHETYQQKTIIKGDEKVPEIALASIIAKVHRDVYMKKISEIYPEYGFQSHVGYGTKAHYEALKVYGLTPLHRRSFLKKVINNL
jgi:ribonuclease HII